MPDVVATHCPYCGEPIELIIDASAGSTEYVEDCQVCCRPMQVVVTIDADDTASVQVHTADD